MMSSRALLVAALVVNLVVAVVPFRLDLPRPVSNRLEHRQGGIWQFRDPSIARTLQGPPWLTDARQTGSITVYMRVRSDGSGQHGPARIFTSSANFRQRNITIGQQDTDLVVRLRRPGSDPNGVPALVVPDVLHSGRWRDVMVEISPGRVRVLVDGKTRVDRLLPDNALAGWNPDFVVALGNEVIGERAWTGAIAAAEVTTPARRHDLLASQALVVPAGWWHVPERLRSFLDVGGVIGLGVALLHLLAFVPVGFLLVRTRARQASWAAVLREVGALSLTIELLKVAIAGRHPSIVNLCAQLVGGLGGALMSATSRRWR